MIVVTMGVCGSGKTCVGEIIASRMGWAFIEGDDLHPAANREKMASGMPLTDDDRWPWLDCIAGRMRAIDEAGGSAVVACSALRQVYRDRLRRSGADICFLHLTGDARVIRRRMDRRSGLRRFVYSLGRGDGRSTDRVPAFVVSVLSSILP